MIAHVLPSRLSGCVRAPVSKSDAHRKLIFAYLAGKPASVEVGEAGDDVERTCSCLSKLGVNVRREGALAFLEPALPGECPCLDAGESGSTLRFLLPVVCSRFPRARFTGGERLRKRPLLDLLNAMRENGVSFSADTLPLETRGTLRLGIFRLPGNVSSQYVSGLLMALPGLNGDSEIRLNTPLESRAYVRMTLRAMRAFGLNARETPNGYFVPGNQRAVIPGDGFEIASEGDWSNAAFWLAAGALKPGNEITVTGLFADSAQGDKEILNILEAAGASVSVRKGLAEEESRVTVCAPSSPLPARADVSGIPDLASPLTALFAFAQGESELLNAARLRFKESDRLSGLAELVSSLGGRAFAGDDCLTVLGGGLDGGVFDACGDHRLAMAAVIAASASARGASVVGAEAVNKSYPGFFRDFARLGGRFTLE